MQYTMLNYGIVLNNAYTGKKQHIQNFLMKLIKDITKLEARVEEIFYRRALGTTATASTII